MEIDVTKDGPMVRRRRCAPVDRVVRAVLTLAGDGARLLRHSERGWASITFSGTRHTLVVEFPTSAIAAGETFIAALPEHEFTIARLLVADATVSAVTHELLPEARMEVEVELLVLDDR